MKHLVTINAPHFCASLVLDKATQGVVLEAAPILRWTLGKRWAYLQGYCNRRGWSWAIQPDPSKLPCADRVALVIPSPALSEPECPYYCGACLAGRPDECSGWCANR